MNSIIYITRLNILIGVLTFQFLLSSDELHSQHAETSTPSLEDIFKKNIFSSKSLSGIHWMRDGKYYTTLENLNGVDDQIIAKYDITTGKQTDVLLHTGKIRPSKTPKLPVIKSYTFSNDEKLILLATDVENIYRRSTKAYHYIYDISTQSILPLGHSQKQSYATFSPDGRQVAYVSENNLYIYNVYDQSTTLITKDGKFNEIINGSADWVYEEELYLTKAFEWSPDSKKIAFLRFDESHVKEYNMQIWGGLYPVDYRFKYPKAGEENAIVKVYIHDLESGNNLLCDTGENNDIYLPRIYWLPNARQLSVIRMNRLQNQLDLLHINTQNGEAEVVLSESAETYVNLTDNDDLRYLRDGKHFIMTSEKSGYKHIYLYSTDGRQIKQITQGNWEVDKLVGIDEKEKIIYYTSTEKTPLERHLYSIQWDTNQKKRLSNTDGVHIVDMSPDCKYYIDSHSSISRPQQQDLHKADGVFIRNLLNNKELKAKTQMYGMVDKEFFEVSAADGSILFGYLLKPAEINTEKKLPLLIHVYGGPGSSQLVMNKWAGCDWHQYLVSLGYAVACIDNRGTNGRGVSFGHATYGLMGKLELEDQLKGVEYLKTLPYVDPERIGIWGWSYGGYMSSLALFLAADTYKAAIAVAPVANWRFYDTIFTERYLGLPQDNAEGYDSYSPLSHTRKLQGKYLLVHGTGDDNVHFQNAIHLQDALIKHEKQFESFYYPNKNHSIQGGTTRFHLYTMMTAFILRSL
ncbi:MAG: S9 family peptidase [Cyclobacteriaceae bacterium]|nr:S9 family peptidase [Cyclobacteriaceae bacterium]